MTPQDEKNTRKALPSGQSVAITKVRSPQPGAVDDGMANFCIQFKTIVPEARIKSDSHSSFAPPAMIVGRHANIAYQAIPEGKILELFLDALGQSATISRDPIESGLEVRMTQIRLPVVLKAYIAAQCPHCPITLRKLQTLAGASDKIRLSVIDAALFHKEAQADGVRSVPTVILDDQFRWSGQIDLSELLTISIERDPALLSPTSLRQLIEEGAAETVARMMIDSGQIFAALIELLAHERWSVRLGAMVTVEYLAASSPDLVTDLVAPLWQRMAAASPQAQGDMVHVLGQIPSQASRRHLRSIAEGDFTREVAAAAAETLNQWH